MGASGFIPEYYEDYAGQFVDLLPHSELIAIGYARAACGHRVVIKTVRWTSEIIDLAELAKVTYLHPGTIRSHFKKELHLARFAPYICDMCSIMREALDGR